VSKWTEEDRETTLTRKQLSKHLDDLFRPKNVPSTQAQAEREEGEMTKLPDMDAASDVYAKRLNEELAGMAPSGEFTEAREHLTKANAYLELTLQALESMKGTERILTGLARISLAMQSLRAAMGSLTKAIWPETLETLRGDVTPQEGP